MDREIKHPTSPKEEQALRGYYQRYKEEHAPSDDMFQRMFETIPQAESSKISAKGSWLDRWRSGWHWSFASGLVAACALFLWWQSGQGYLLNGNQNATQPRTFVPKSGDVSFSLLHSKHTSQGYIHQQTTRMGERLHAGDGVQLSYQVPDKMHVMLVSLNERGEVSVFVPFGKTTSIEVQAGTGTLPQQSALTLDQYVGKERFFFLYSNRSFTLKKVKQSAQQTFHKANRSLQNISTLPGSWQSKTILIVKSRKSKVESQKSKVKSQ